MPIPINCLFILINNSHDYADEDMRENINSIYIVLFPYD